LLRRRHRSGILRPRHNPYRGGSEPRYEEIAMMSSSDRLATTGFINAAAFPRARAMSHIEELSCDIQQLQPREPRDFAQAFQRLAVTERALHTIHPSG
jgi:hypothetical protein